MACDITQGRAGKVCKNNLGGNDVVYIYNYLEDPFTYDAATGLATGINPNLNQVFEFGIEGDGNTLVQDVTSDRNTGTSVNTQTLTLVLKKMDADTNATFNLLTKGYAQAVVKDRNGNYHALGIDDGMDFAVNAQTGGAKTDLNSDSNRYNEGISTYFRSSDYNRILGFSCINN
ncbi:hypothetical protein AB832_05230 [Flavobacteriaceae bacterium (ex Bugula neritina AB1)]|nr:hypothetical protein AB832_05230 [Flavobacteriaceae bacterium (ex Bugula neritina AB1)]